MNTGRLWTSLRRFNRGVLRRELGRGVLLGIAALGMALLAALIIDAAIGLAPVGLLLLDFLLLGAVVTAVLLVVACCLRHRFEPRRVAVELERRLHDRDNRLINAVQLSEAGPPGTSDALRQMAVDLGDTAAEQIHYQKVIDRRPLRRALAIGGLAMGLFAGALVVMPRVFFAVVPRLLQPMADHPPFTRLQFRVTTEPQRVVLGQPAAIHVTLSGPRLPQRAEVVFVDQVEGPKRLTMLRDSDLHAPWIVTAAAAGPARPAVESGRYRLPIDRAEKSRVFYIDTPAGRSRRNTMPVHPVPLFEQVHATYEYPSYSGWPAAAEPLADAGIRALAGTHVTLRVQSNVALGGGSLRLKTDANSIGAVQIAIEPDIQDPHFGIARFELRHSGRAALDLAGRDGTPSDAPYEFAIEVVPDALPKVTIDEPPTWIVVPESWSVDVKIIASDDIGIDRILLFRGVNGWGPQSVELPIRQVNDNRALAQATSQFDLPSLGAVAGDVITYFAVAYDNRPGEAQFSETPVHAIQVISDDEYLEYERTRYHVADMNNEWDAVQQRLEELEAMRDHILQELKPLQAQLASGDALTEAQQQQMAALERDLEQYSDQAMDLFEEIRQRADQATLYEFEQPYKEMLDKLGLQLQAQAAEAAGLRSSMGKARQTDSPQARAAMGARSQRFAELDAPFNESTQQEMQWTSDQLEMLRLADELIAQGERIRMVAEQQQDVSQRMASLRNSAQLSRGEQHRADALAQEEAALRQELADARSGLQEAVEQARETLPKMSAGAQSICDRIGQMQIDQDLADAQRRADAGQGPGAYAAAQSAAEKLDSLLSDCESLGSGQASADLDGCFGLPRERLANALQQMAQGRNVPGMGQQGSSGTGFSGSMARMAIMGPAGQGGESEAGYNLSGRAGRGRGGGSGAGAADEHGEVLDPGAAAARSGGGAAILGVPSKYQQEAQAYFKRLADENQTQDK